MDLDPAQEAGGSSFASSPDLCCLELDLQLLSICSVQRRQTQAWGNVAVQAGCRPSSLGRCPLCHSIWECLLVWRRPARSPKAC